MCEFEDWALFSILSGDMYRQIKYSSSRFSTINTLFSSLHFWYIILIITLRCHSFLLVKTIHWRKWILKKKKKNWGFLWIFWVLKAPRPLPINQDVRINAWRCQADGQTTVLLPSKCNNLGLFDSEIHYLWSSTYY